MSHAVFAVMQAPDESFAHATHERRHSRNLRILKAVLLATAAATASAIVVASCLVRDTPRRGAETTSAGAPGRATDTGSVAGPAEVYGITTVTSGDVDQPDDAGDEPEPLRAAPAASPPTQTPAAEPEPGSPPTSANDKAATGDAGAAPSNAEVARLASLLAQIAEAYAADGGTPVAGHAAHADNDSNARPEPAEQEAAKDAGASMEPPEGPSASVPKRPPWAPTMSAGAGPFLTEPQPWQASAMVPNPQAGAGPFTTETNMPTQVVYYGLPTTAGQAIAPQTVVPETVVPGLSSPAVQVSPAAQFTVPSPFPPPIIFPTGPVAIPVPTR